MKFYRLRYTVPRPLWRGGLPVAVGAARYRGRITGATVRIGETGRGFTIIPGGPR